MSSLSRKISRFVRQKKGGAAIMFGLFVLPMLGASGLALDVGRAHLVKTRLGYALDAAGLAVASSQGTVAEMEERLNRYIQANFPDEVIGEATSIELTIDGNFVTVVASAQVETTFMSVFGYDDITVQTSNQVVREVKGVEVVMVLDTTGSMWTNNNYLALRDAGVLFLDSLFGDEDYNEDLRVGIVPYSASVNVGAEAVGIVDNTPSVSYSATDHTKWQGCVVERPYPNDVRDTTTAQGGLWEKYYWARDYDNYWTNSNYRWGYNHCNSQRNPNAGCPQPIMDLHSDKSDLVNKVQGLFPWCRGGTMSPLGMAWGWRVLSPQSPFSSGSDYDDDKWQKVAILMTDGDNMYSSPSSTGWPYYMRNPYRSDMTGYGRLDDAALGTTSWSTARTRINQRLEEVCNNMKAEGITIYTITFTSRINEATRDYYRRCASDPSKYSNAPTQEDLRTVFANIGGELSNLRLTR